MGAKHNMASLIKIRRDTATNWNTKDPVLSIGEPGYDTTNNKIKVGNGTDPWSELSYLTDATGNPDLTGYATEDWVGQQGYITIEDVPTVLPANSAGVLTNDGTGLLSWTTPSGLPEGTRIVSPPGTSQGANGDQAGDIAFDANSVYYCKQNYSFVPPTIVTAVAVDGNTVWIDDADRPGLDTDFLSITGTWRLRNGDTDYTVTSVTADAQYSGSYALVLGTTPDPVFVVYNDYNLYQPSGINIWVKSNWTSTGSW